MLTADVEEKLYGYLNGIARKVGSKLLIGNGTEDHVHLLMDLPPALSVSEAMKKLKGNSSRWLSRIFPLLSDFAWQEGFGAFSVSASPVNKVFRYIERQKEHHNKKSFSEEFEGLLKSHGIEFDLGMLE